MESNRNSSSLRGSNWHSSSRVHSGRLNSTRSRSPSITRGFYSRKSCMSRSKSSVYSASRSRSCSPNLLGRQSSKRYRSVRESSRSESRSPSPSVLYNAGSHGPLRSKTLCSNSKGPSSGNVELSNR